MKAFCLRGNNIKHLGKSLCQQVEAVDEYLCPFKHAAVCQTGAHIKRDIFPIGKAPRKQLFISFKDHGGITQLVPKGLVLPGRFCLPGGTQQILRQDLQKFQRGQQLPHPLDKARTLLRPGVKLQPVLFPLQRAGQRHGLPPLVDARPAI